MEEQGGRQAMREASPLSSVWQEVRRTWAGARVVGRGLSREREGQEGGTPAAEDCGDWGMAYQQQQQQQQQQLGDGKMAANDE